MSQSKPDNNTSSAVPRSESASASRRGISAILQFVIAFVGLFLLFNVGLYLVCTFDSKLIEKNVQTSQKILFTETITPNIIPLLFVSNDNDSDAAVLNEIYSVDSSQPLVSYLKAPRNFRATNTATIQDNGDKSLCAFYDDSTKQKSFSYNISDRIVELGQFLHGDINITINGGRFWYGYFLLYRPLLVWLNISQIRWFLLAIFGVLYACLVFLLHRKFGSVTAIIYGASLLCSGYCTAWFSIMCAPIFLTMMVGSVVLLLRLEKLKNIYLFIFVVACVTNYFDRLTIPEITLGLPVSIYLIFMQQNGRDWKTCVKFIACSTAVWLLGYNITWLSKWIEYNAVLDSSYNMISDGLTFGILRQMNPNISDYFTDLAYIDATITIAGKATFFAALIFGGLFVYERWTTRERNGYCPLLTPFACLAGLPLLWRLILARQTTECGIYAYRDMLIFVIAILLFFEELLFGKLNSSSDKTNATQ